MDYEFRIKVAEEELAHLRKMQLLMQAHQDSHDKSIMALGSRMDRAEADLAEAAATLKETNATVLLIGQKLSEVGTSLSELIQALRG